MVMKVRKKVFQGNKLKEKLIVETHTNLKKNPLQIHSVTIIVIDALHIHKNPTQACLKTSVLSFIHVLICTHLHNIYS